MSTTTKKTPHNNSNDPLMFKEAIKKQKTGKTHVISLFKFVSVIR